MGEVKVKIEVEGDLTNVEMVGDPESVAVVSRAMTGLLMDTETRTVEELVQSTDDIEVGTVEGGEALDLDDVGELILRYTEPGETYMARDIAVLTGQDTARVASALCYRVSDEFEVDRSSKSNRYTRKKRVKKEVGEMDPDEVAELDKSLKRHFKQDQQIERETVGDMEGTSGY